MSTTLPQVQESWEIDAAHSSVNFTVRHMVITKVRGRFTSFKGTVTTGPEAHTEVEIDAASIDTGMPDRDKHLKNADFLDVATYPTLAFRSKRLEGDRLVGELTLHGVTREVTLELEENGRTRDPWGGERVGYSAKTTIDRKDYGLEWNQVLETGGLLVGTKIEIELDVQAVKKG